MKELLDRAIRAGGATEQALMGKDLDDHGRLLGALFLRILGSARSVALLVDHGLNTDGEVVVRSAVQALVFLVHCAKDEATALRFVNNHQVLRKKWANVAKSHPEMFGDLIDLDGLDQVKEEVDREVAAGGAMNDSLEALAHAVDLDGLYQIAYRVLSGVEHVSPQSLERFLDDSDPERICLNPGPHERVLPHLLTSAALLLIRAREVILGILGGGDDEQEALRSALLAIGQDD